MCNNGLLLAWRIDCGLREMVMVTKKLWWITVFESVALHYFFSLCIVWTNYSNIFRRRLVHRLGFTIWQTFHCVVVSDVWFEFAMIWRMKIQPSIILFIVELSYHIYTSLGPNILQRVKRWSFVVVLCKISRNIMLFKGSCHYNWREICIEIVCLALNFISIPFFVGSS